MMCTVSAALCISFFTSVHAAAPLLSSRSGRESQSMPESTPPSSLPRQLEGDCVDEPNAPRFTLEGCACKQTWIAQWMNESVTNYCGKMRSCGNPHWGGRQDDCREWCIVVDPACYNHTTGWGFCSPTSKCSTTTTTMSITTTRAATTTTIATAATTAATTTMTVEPTCQYTAHVNTAIKKKGTGGAKLRRDSFGSFADYLCACKEGCDADPTCGGFVDDPTDKRGQMCKPKKASLEDTYSKYEKTFYEKIAC